VTRGPTAPARRAPRASHLTFALVMAASAVVETGCDATLNGPITPSLTYTEDARKAYDEAMGSFRDKDWESARALFDELRKLFPQSRYARLAELRIADIDFAQEKYTEAIGSYRTFVTNHRNDREVEYARYRLAKALYFDVDDTFFLPPAEERDQATASEAHREIQSFLKQYPRSRYRRDAEYMLDVVTGRLVRHELYVARYYRRRDNFIAALARIDYATKTFPTSALYPEALVLRGETLMMMDRRAEAKVAFETVIKDYGAPFSEPAKRFLDELADPTQDKTTVRRQNGPERSLESGLPEEGAAVPAAPKLPLPTNVDVNIRSNPQAPPGAGQ
jgi:outer membrane protein assembly factor BamD